VRDLSHAEPWRESHERSLMRRDAPVTGRPVRGRDNARRSRMLAASIAGVFMLALVAVALPHLLDRGGPRASATAAPATVSATAAPATVSPAAAVRSYAAVGRETPCAGGARAWEAGSCQVVAQDDRYINPLAGAKVTPERIDQGVDYAGSGPLGAIGAARITYVAASAPGWPGAFIEYQLIGGPYRGRHVYYAEGVVPAPGLHLGETVHPGQAIATIIPYYATGIEIGWGAGIATNTYAAERHEWNETDDADNVATASGKSFSALIASLGGPPGKVEG